MRTKISMLLVICIILSMMAVLSSCKEEAPDVAATSVTTTNGSGEDPETALYEDLPSGSYAGYSFNILNSISNYAITTIVPETTTETIDSALFARNGVVKEKLGIELIETRMGYNEVKSTMQSLTSSEDFEYDIAFNEVHLQTPLAQFGTYLQVSDYDEHLNLGKPWWFTDAMDSIAIDGNGFELFGDLHLMYYDSIWGMTFNQQDFLDNKQTFPYDLVRAGNWTFGELEKIMKATYQKPGSEHYAIVSPRDFASAMISATGFVLISQDDDSLKIFEDEDRFVEIYTAVMELFYASNGPGKMNAVIADYKSQAYLSGIFDDLKPRTTRIFAEGKATFMAGTVGGIRMVRDSEFDYGIIPLPKYDTDQPQYISWIYQGASSCGIPATNTGVERTCVILENLAAYSYKLVKHEYYDIVVQGRTVRDNDSIEMLDIIFGHTELGYTRFEIDTTYRLGISDQVRKSMSDNVTEIIVEIDGIMGSVSTNVESLIEAYK